MFTRPCHMIEVYVDAIVCEENSLGNTWRSCNGISAWRTNLVLQGVKKRPAMECAQMAFTRKVVCKARGVKQLRGPQKV
jgi:hypothetical protein